MLPKLLDGIHKLGDFEITLVPRYEEQRDWARRMFGKMATVPSDAIDGVEEVSKTDSLSAGVQR